MPGPDLAAGDVRREGSLGAEDRFSVTPPDRLGSARKWLYMCPALHLHCWFRYPTCCSFPSDSRRSHHLPHRYFATTFSVLRYGTFVRARSANSLHPCPIPLSMAAVTRPLSTSAISTPTRHGVQSRQVTRAAVVRPLSAADRLPNGGRCRIAAHPPRLGRQRDSVKLLHTVHSAPSDQVTVRTNSSYHPPPPPPSTLLPSLHHPTLLPSYLAPNAACNVLSADPESIGPNSPAGVPSWITC